MAENAAAAAAAAAAANWRGSVLQSYRSAEVREIAKVLAALEGSSSVTPASKLMLAMRFEDQIFKSAGSLADYRKKISKRLKKLQKNYVRPTTNASPKAQQTVSETAAREDNTEAKAELINKLKREYGEELSYIVKHAAMAGEDLERKLGPEKAKQLQQHTDSCRLWARDLGILSKEELDAIPASLEKQTGNEPLSSGGNTTTATNINNNNIAAPLSFAQLQRIEQHLQTRVGNIRSYVVKHADPDQFLQETLQTKDVAFSKNVLAGNLFKSVLQGMLSTHKEQIQKAAASTGDNSHAPPHQDEEPLIVVQKALEKALAGVPPPTRQDSRMLEGSLRHLDKIRAASQAMMTYWALPGDQRMSTAPRETLKKIHEVVHEGTDFLLEAIHELERKKKQKEGVADDQPDAPSSSSASTPTVSLQDAWSKRLELTSTTALSSASAPIDVDADENANNETANLPNKRPRTQLYYKPYIMSRMLFRGSRKTPLPLLAAIKRKGARIKMANDANATHLVLDFEDAFRMTIYFSPLTATLRARSPEDDEDNGRHAWQPLSHGLTLYSSKLDSSDFRTKREAGVGLSVWGVSGSYDGIGRVVEERLRDASTHATCVLRNCFKNHVKDKTVSFEVELLEGSALLEFLQVARSTYMPHWEDADV